MNIVPLREGVLEGIWPQFLLHDRLSNRYWNRIYAEFPAFQFAMVEDGEVVAEGNCIPVAGRPAQWRDAFLAAFERGGEPDRVCALAIMVSPDHQRRGIARAMLEHMRELAAPLGKLVAPVRPTRKWQYPLFSIEDYVTWRREDGAHFDQWLRLHEAVGGKITGTAPEAMLIEAPVASWTEWTGLEFPSDGEYVVPGALVPVHFANGHGTYREPCVWVDHETG